MSESVNEPKDDRFQLLKLKLDRHWKFVRPKEYRKARKNKLEFERELHQKAMYAWEQALNRPEGESFQEMEWRVLLDLFPMSEEEEEELRREAEEPDPIEEWLAARQSAVVVLPDGRAFREEDLDENNQPYPDAEPTNPPHVLEELRRKRNQQASGKKEGSKTNATDL